MVAPRGPPKVKSHGCLFPKVSNYAELETSTMTDEMFFDWSETQNMYTNFVFNSLELPKYTQSQNTSLISENINIKQKQNNIK
jgi:hypothetical protein